MRRIDEPVDGVVGIAVGVREGEPPDLGPRIARYFIRREAPKSSWTVRRMELVPGADGGHRDE